MSDDDRTVDADEATMDELRRLAAEARERAGDPQPAPDRVRSSAPSTFDPPTFDAPTFDPPAFEPPAPDSAPESAPPARTPAGAPEPPAGADRVWRPPPRMVMPTEPEKQHEVHHGPWRTIAIVLAGLVVALVVFLLVWIFVIDGDEPNDQPEIDPLTSLPIDSGGGGDVDGGVDGGTGDVSEGGG